MGMPMGMPMGMGPPRGGPPGGMGMNINAATFVPGVGMVSNGPPPPQQQQMQAPPEPTDEEQEWLDSQMAAAEKEKAAAKPEEASIDDVPPEVQAAGATPEAPKPLEDHTDVMKMIEENRKKNEAKRAAQSARNAEIIAAFEARQ